jgi:hypothetical protein
MGNLRVPKGYIHVPYHTYFIPFVYNRYRNGVIGSCRLRLFQLRDKIIDIIKLLDHVDLGFEASALLLPPLNFRGI